ncbi:MAG: FAD-dependent oxidoreductase [Acidobacteria bacterium]|nr:FAD-dependent oxidoreductase [Acidobacteriota bacterium]
MSDTSTNAQARPWPAPPRVECLLPREVETEVAILGAGIHGAALARELTLRGVRCAVMDLGSVGGGTSQWSSQLLHGGIRYLQTGDIGQMKEGLRERAAWARIAPSRCRWEAFWMPHRGLWEGFTHRVGIGFYDRWGSDRPGWPESLSLGAVPDRQFRMDPRAIRTAFRGAVAYADLLTHDRDLVRDLMASSDALLLDFHEVMGFEDDGSALTAIKLRHRLDPGFRTVKAKHFVFALGPWMDGFMAQWFGETKNRLRLSSGIHLWFDPSGTPLERCERPWAMMRSKGRILFVIPRDGLIQVGTTEREVEDGCVPIAESEREDLYDVLGRIIPGIAWRELPVAFEELGVRPLVAASGGTDKLSREAVLETHARFANLRLVLGGKLTTARALMDRLATELTGKPCPASLTEPLRVWDGQRGPI